MSTVKISDLPAITHLNTDTTQSIIPVVDIVDNITGKVTVRALAEGLFAYDSLKVGEQDITLSNTIAQFSSSGTPFLQVNLQNIDGNSSSDYVATADIGTNANNFIDMGINGSTFTDSTYSAMQALDGYLYVQGSLSNSTNGNLVIGTASTGANVVIAPGGTTTSNVVAHFTKHGLVMKNSANVEFSDGSIQTVAAAPANYTQSAFNTANTAATNISIMQGVNTTQNTNITSVNQYAASGYAKANNALANTSGTFAGNLNVSGYITLNTVGGIYQETASPSIMTANTTGYFQIVTNRTIRPHTFSFGQNGSLDLPGNITANGTMVLANSNFSNTESAVTISATPTVATPSNDGYMLHISGKEGVPSRIVFDSYGSGAYGLVAGRTARGTVASPTAVANGDILMRVSGNGHGGAGAGWTTTGVARIDIVATENYSATNRGSQIQFWNVPIGSNTLQQIATFNGDSVHFTGVVNPQKGLSLSPNVVSGITNTLNIDIANNSLYKITIDNTATINLSGYQAGKIVEVWMTNSSGSNRTVTHGCTALNSTVNSTTVTIPATSSAYFKYFSIDGDNANTFVSVIHA